jgi:type I restriction enzyme S subunit
VAEMVKYSVEPTVGQPEGFKMTELGPLPEEWEVARLKEIAKFTKRPKGLVLGKQIAFVPMELIPDDASIKPGCRLIRPNELKSGTYCEPGDVLVARITPCFENGKQAIVPDDHRVVWFTSTEVFPLKANPQFIERNFLFYYLRLPDVRQEIAAKMEGTTGRQRIPKQVFANHLVPLPPLYEQRAIAHVLRTVQRAKEATERVIQATRELKKSLMRYLFTYGPVSVEEAESVPLKETEIGLVPEHWDVVKLGDVAKTASGGTPSRKNPEYFGGKIHWVKSGELNDSLVSCTEETLTEMGIINSNARVFPKGTLLIAMYGATAGKVGILECEAASNQAVCAVFPQKILSSNFLFYVFMYRRSKLLSERYGGAQPNISQTVIKAFNIPLPPLHEQHEIVRILQAVDKKLQAEEARKQALEALFKTLLNNLMTGKIRVKDVVLPNVGEGKGDVTH